MITAVACGQPAGARPRLPSSPRRLVREREQMRIGNKTVVIELARGCSIGRVIKYLKYLGDGTARRGVRFLVNQAGRAPGKRIIGGEHIRAGFRSLGCK